MRRPYDPTIDIMARRHISAAAMWNHWCLSFLGIPPEDAHALWAALERADGARSLIFAWQHLCRARPSALGILDVLDEHLRPTRFLPLIDHLVEQQLLSRAIANEVSEKILVRTDKHGRWREEPPP